MLILVGLFGIATISLLLIVWYILLRSLERIDSLSQQLADERQARASMDREVLGRVESLRFPLIAPSTN